MVIIFCEIKYTEIFFDILLFIIVIHVCLNFCMISHLSIVDLCSYFSSCKHIFLIICGKNNM
uniref:Uncharacterized protein n=1 Tax=Symphyocladiella dendroidea TaxID=2506487 RepID=A0A1Z1M872_9FLOR|nr:hypothetical protein [Symphyocladiella dendroidea]ARW61954.1 hypothetical protein [Symphyocladiella dendroidea]